MLHLFARQSFWPGRFLKQDLPRIEATDVRLTSRVCAILIGYRMAPFAVWRKTQEPDARGDAGPCSPLYRRSTDRDQNDERTTFPLHSSSPQCSKTRPFAGPPMSQSCRICSAGSRLPHDAKPSNKASTIDFPIRDPKRRHTDLHARTQLSLAPLAIYLDDMVLVGGGYQSRSCFRRLRTHLHVSLD
jgi:hypothetical protein